MKDGNSTVLYTKETQGVKIDWQVAKSHFTSLELQSSLAGFMVL
jgi:hypothetical protein